MVKILAVNVSNTMDCFVVKVIEMLVRKWHAEVDSSLLSCERDVIIKACNEGDVAKIRHVVQDLYSQVWIVAVGFTTRLMGSPPHSCFLVLQAICVVV